MRLRMRLQIIHRVDVFSQKRRGLLEFGLRFSRQSKRKSCLVSPGDSSIFHASLDQRKERASLISVLKRTVRFFALTEFFYP